MKLVSGGIAQKVVIQGTGRMVVVEAKKFTLLPTNHWPLNRLGHATSRVPSVRLTYVCRKMHTPIAEILSIKHWDLPLGS
ncbi:hypothetical protein [Salmonella enterica]|uniref:hypothetical protein n=1 Tax=Salmonella enterica TaxID=28901 RepID=UPI00398C4F16